MKRALLLVCTLLVACGHAASERDRAATTVPQRRVRRALAQVEIVYHDDKPFAKRGDEEWSLGDLRRSEMIFSPDGRRFAVTTPPKGRSQIHRLVVRNVAGDPVNEFPLYRAGVPEVVTWLDNHRLGYLAPAMPEARLAAVYVVHDVESGEVLQARSGATFVWGPERHHVAFVAGAGDKQSVIVDGRTVWPRSGTTRLHNAPVWSPDGHGLAIVADGAVTGTAKLVVLLEYDDPHGDLTWNVPKDAPPPPFAYERDPDEVWLIPDYDVYYVPTIDVDVFFYGDRWYRRSGSNWYFSLDLRGPWGWARVEEVPAPVLRVPPDYRRQPARYQRVPYGIWKKQGYRWGTQPPPPPRYEPPSPPPRYEPPAPPPRAPWSMDHDPDEVWLIPGSGVFFVPRLEVDLFYFGGSWFMHGGNDWYRGGNPRGPWSQTVERQVPEAIRRLPADFRTPQRYQRVPYGQWRDRGYTWQEDRPAPPRPPVPPPPPRNDPRDQNQSNDRAPLPPPRVQPPPPPQPREQVQPPPPAREPVRAPVREEMGPRIDRDPQEVLLIRKTRIFLVDAEGGDVFFFDGRWYGRTGERWFTGPGLRGPWSALRPEQAPPEVRNVAAGNPRKLKSVRVPFDEWARKGYRWEEPAEDDKGAPPGQGRGSKNQ